MKRLHRLEKTTHKQNKEKKKSAHEQPSATSHHLPAAWNTDSEGDAAGSGRSQKAAQLPFTTTSPVFSGGCLVPAHERPALPSDLTHTVTDAFFFLAPSSMNVKTSCVSRNGMNTPGLLPKMHDWLRAIAHLG